MVEELNVYEMEILNRIRNLENYEAITIRRTSPDSPWVYKYQIRKNGKIKKLETKKDGD